MTSISSPLIRSAIAGDHVALLELLEAARPDIRRYARSRCRANDVDDAVQETLWLLFRRISTLRVATSFSAWLFAIARRECLRLARGLGSAPDELDGERAVMAQSDEALRLDLAKAIQSLPHHYRTIVVMRDIEERSINEIANALGKTRESVKARLHRARILLRENLLR